MFLDQQWIKIASLNFVIISSTFPGRHSRFFNDYFIQSSAHLIANLRLPGAPLIYFNDGGVRRIFLGLTFWPTGIFLGRENNTGIFLGIVFFISSNQQ